MKNQYRFMKPPTPIRRAHLDNIGLVPANLLPEVQRWHKLAGEIKDELVIVLPEKDTKQRQTLTAVAALLRGHGQVVRVVEQSELTPPRFGDVVQAELGI